MNQNDFHTSFDISIQIFIIMFLLTTHSLMMVMTNQLPLIMNSLYLQYLSSLTIKLWFSTITLKTTIVKISISQQISWNFRSSRHWHFQGSSTSFGEILLCISNNHKLQNEILEPKMIYDHYQGKFFDFPFPRRKKNLFQENWIEESCSSTLNHVEKICHWNICRNIQKSLFRVHHRLYLQYFTFKTLLILLEGISSPDSATNINIPSVPSIPEIDSNFIDTGSNVQTSNNSDEN